MSSLSNVVDWRKCVGKRVLVVEQLDAFMKLTDYPKEVKVVAVSPSGKYVKLDFGSGGKWCSANAYVVVEVLD